MRKSLASASLAVLTGIAAFTVAGRAAADHVDCANSDWGCLGYGSWPLEGGPAAGQRVTVLGDSLLQNMGSRLLNELVANGFHAFTNGAGGSAYWHWNVGYIVHNQNIRQIITSHGSRHVVLALGANDARVLAGGDVTRDEVADQVLKGMDDADAATPGCVILVQPASHGTGAYNTAAAQVRDVLSWLATIRNNQYGTPHFVLINWHTHSLNHPGWFAGSENIHHSPEGQVAYSNFITWHMAVARNGGFGC
jgi:hypothetical protein